MLKGIFNNKIVLKNKYMVLMVILSTFCTLVTSQDPSKYSSLAAGVLLA